MSFIPEQNLTGRHLVAQFILSHRKKGHVLPYIEYEYIGKWLRLAEGEEDQLLLILSEIIPQFFKERQDWSYPPSLKIIDQKVCRILIAKSRRRIDL